MSVSRRAFATGLALVPLAGANSQPVPQTVESNSPVASDTSEWSAQVFDAHQLETVAVLAECIIPTTDTPGAREALVHKHLDHILAESPEAERTKFLEGLWWMDGYCLRTGAKPFKDLPPTEQMQIALKLYESSEPDLKPGTQFLHLAKTWTARIYYSTQIGVQELNKNGRVPPSYISGCGAMGSSAFIRVHQRPIPLEKS
jgi:Gluconate 2-dehydrogenase subunit 3